MDTSFIGFRFIFYYNKLELSCRTLLWEGDDAMEGWSLMPQETSDEKQIMLLKLVRGVYEIEQLILIITV